MMFNVLRLFEQEPIFGVILDLALVHPSGSSEGQAFLVRPYRWRIVILFRLLSAMRRKRTLANQRQRGLGGVRIIGFQD